MAQHLKSVSPEHLTSAGVRTAQKAADGFWASSAVLTSYLGQSSDLAGGGTQTSADLPNLDITPVTTAALAVYAQLNGGSYANLSRSAIATTMQTYGDDILVIAAAIKAVGDNLCTPSTTVNSTSNLARSIAANANLTTGQSTTLSNAAAALGGNCATALATLPQVIQSDRIFGTQLASVEPPEHKKQDSKSPQSPESRFAGTYQLQSLVAETGISANPTAANISGTPTAATPANVFADAAVNIGTNGAITSADGNVKGAVFGNVIVLTVVNGTKSYTLRGKISGIPAALVSGGKAFSVQGGGVNSATNVVTRFTAVLASAGAKPVWNGIAVPTSKSQKNGVACAAGQPVRLHGFIRGVGGGTEGACIVPNATGWTMAAPTSIANPVSFNLTTGSKVPVAPTLTAPTWTEVQSAPFILTDSGASFALNSGSAAPISGTTYYVMGTQAIAFSTATSNNVLSVSDNPLMRIAAATGPGTSH
jgi:hypothetical protein